MGAIPEHYYESLPPEAAALGHIVGPFYTAEAFASRVGQPLEHVEAMVAEGDALAVITSDSQLLFPVRQLEDEQSGAARVRYGVRVALRALIENETDYGVAAISTENGTALIDEWTVAAVLLRRDNNGVTLLDDLEADPNAADTKTSEAWYKLLSLDGILPDVHRAMLHFDSPDEQSQ